MNEPDPPYCAFYPSVREEKRFKREVLLYLNAKRQANQQPIFRNILKFKNLIGAEDNEDAYNILSDAVCLSNEGIGKTQKYPNNRFMNLNNLKGLLWRNYKGKEIYLIIQDEDRNGVIGNRGLDLTNLYYQVPDTRRAFNTWWNSKEWNFKSSDENVFEQNPDGSLYITESQVINAERINQLYLDNSTANCLTLPIRLKCLEKGDSKNYKTILNKCDKLEKKYKDGIPKDLLDEICKNLNIKIKLVDAFGRNKTEYGKEKGLLTISLINTRFNHVEQYYNLDDKDAIFCSRERLEEIYNSLRPDDFICKKNVAGIYLIRTAFGIHKLESTYYDTFMKFEKNYKLDECYLDFRKDKFVSDFICYGAKMTSFVINPIYKDNLRDYINNHKVIDQTKSYTQFHTYEKFYKGFVGKITDFRKTNRLEGLGYYLIGSIDWTHADKKIKHIQRTFKVWSGKNIYSSVELEYLIHYGATFKIKGGCWGMRIDFKFNDDMLKKDTGIPNYSLWTGMKASREEYDYYYTKSYNEKFVADLKHSNPTCKINYFKDRDEVQFGIKKENVRHLTQVSGFIYAYQRIGLLEQLREMDIDKVIRINVDGIRYENHAFEIKPTFRYELEPKLNGLIMNERENGFITNTNDNDIWDLMKFNIHFKNTATRQHYNNELYLGAGGTGKTHLNLVDNGLIRVAYIANSYKLISKKRDEYKCNVEILANMLGLGNFENLQRIRRQYNTLIFDEVSMMNEVERKNIMLNFKNFKLIFCGDVGFQAKPISLQGNDVEEINVKIFDNVKVFDKNYRCEDEKLLSLLNGVRDYIRLGASIDDNIKRSIRNVDIDFVAKKYDYKKDIILVHKHATKEKYNKVVSGSKYLITKNCDLYNHGDIYVEDLGFKNVEKTNALTTHSIQGETFLGKIYIDEELLKNNRLFYTAISRAKKLNQLYIVGRKKKLVIIN